MSDRLVNIRMADNPRVNEALRLKFKEVAKVTVRVTDSDTVQYLLGTNVGSLIIVYDNDCHDSHVPKQLW